MSNEEKNELIFPKIRQLVRQGSKDDVPDVSRLSPEELSLLIQEYEAFQIKILSQNQELQEAYQELERTRNRLQQLYDSAPVGYCILSKKGLILEANLTFCRMLNKNKNGLLGYPLNVFLDKGNSSPLYQHLDYVRQTAEKGAVILELQSAGPDCRFIQIESIADTGSAGEILFKCACSDITNWKTLEEEKIRHFRPQSVLNRLLNLTLEDIGLEETLEAFLKHIVSMPWLGLEAAGAVFLLDRDRQILECKAQLDMPRDIAQKCREIKLGQCYCGRAAATGKLIYSKVPQGLRLREDSTPVFPHYLYCVPIGSHETSIIGVYILYLQGPGKRDEIVESTLLAAARILAGVVKHKTTGEELKRSYDHLEKRVQERTAELEEKNIALKVLLEQREKDKKELEKRMVANVRKLIVPYLEKLRHSRVNEEQGRVLNLIDKQLEEITSALIPTLSARYQKMTPSEIQICHLISQGHNSKEIASLMTLSPETVNKHRQNIRRKCGLKNKKINLSSYLATLSATENANGY